MCPLAAKWAAYSQGDMRDRRRPMMEPWASYCMTLIGAKLKSSWR